ncbi:hypothetical protein GCM10011578_098770 [Streptomyces fuscichromogenes]|uniref:Uncharacterized protein n=1 Tax=Streptomyces fuscichromogenes TaxID=1324013 RepID=A0A917XPY8_9ACTN|nr:hypothetical protein GCM10011578_098770 [Streptomyces fuscichromogenes]
MEPDVDGSHPGEAVGTRREWHSGVSVRRSEIEHDTRQPRAAVRGRVLGVHLIEVGAEDERAGGLGKQLGFAGEQAGQHGPDHGDVRVRAGVTAVRAGGTDELAQQHGDLDSYRTRQRRQPLSTDNTTGRR